MKKLKPTKAWIILCSVIAVASSATEHSPHHNGVRHLGTASPWRKKYHNSATPNGIQIADHVLPAQEVSCISADKNIFDIMKEASDTCKGKDLLCTFYFYADHKYYKIGSFNIDKVLFDSLLVKYDNWLLTAEKLDPKDTVPYFPEHHKKIHKNGDININPSDTEYKKVKNVDDDLAQTCRPVSLNEVTDPIFDRSLNIDKFDHDISSKYSIGNTVEDTSVVKEDLETENNIINSRADIDIVEDNSKYENYVQLNPKYDKINRWYEVFLPKCKVHEQSRAFDADINGEKYKLGSENNDISISSKIENCNELSKHEKNMNMVSSRVPKILKDVVNYKENYKDNTLPEEVTTNELRNNHEYKIHPIEPPTVDTNDEPNYETQNNFGPYVFNYTNGNQKLHSEDGAENVKSIVDFSHNNIVPNKYRNHVNYYVGSGLKHDITENIPIDIIDSDVKHNSMQEDTEMFNYNNRNYGSDSNNIKNAFMKNADTLNPSTDVQKVTQELCTHPAENPNIYNERDFDHSHDLIVHRNNSLKSSHIHLNEPVDNMHDTIRVKFLPHTPMSDYTGSQLDLPFFQNEPVNSDFSDEFSIPLSPQHIKPHISKELSKEIEPISPLQFASDSLLTTLIDPLAQIETPSTSSELGLGKQSSTPNSQQNTSSILSVPPMEYVQLIKVGSKMSPLNVGFSWLPSYSRIKELRLPSSESKMESFSPIASSNVEDLSLDSSPVPLLPTIQLKDSSFLHGTPSIGIDISEYTLPNNQPIQEVTSPIYTTSAGKTTILSTSPSNVDKRFTCVEQNNNDLISNPSVTSYSELSPSSLALDIVDPTSNEDFLQSFELGPIALQPIALKTPSSTYSQGPLLVSNEQRAPITSVQSSLATKIETPEAFPLDTTVYITPDKSLSALPKTLFPSTSQHDQQLNVKFSEPSMLPHYDTVFDPKNSPSTITMINQPNDESVKSIGFGEKLSLDFSTLPPLESLHTDSQISLSSDFEQHDKIAPLRTKYSGTDEVTAPTKLSVISKLPATFISTLDLPPFEYPQPPLSVESYSDSNRESSQFVQPNLEQALFFPETPGRLSLITESSAYPSIPSRIISQPNSAIPPLGSEKATLFSVTITRPVEMDASRITRAFANPQWNLQTKSIPPTIISKVYPILKQIPTLINRVPTVSNIQGTYLQAITPKLSITPTSPWSSFSSPSLSFDELPSVPKFFQAQSTAHPSPPERILRDFPPLNDTISSPNSPKSLSYYPHKILFPSNSKLLESSGFDLGSDKSVVPYSSYKPSQILDYSVLPSDISSPMRLLQFNIPLSKSPTVSPLSDYTKSPEVIKVLQSLPYSLQKPLSSFDIPQYHYQTYGFSPGTPSVPSMHQNIPATTTAPYISSLTSLPLSTSVNHTPDSEAFSTSYLNKYPNLETGQHQSIVVKSSVPQSTETNLKPQISDITPQQSLLPSHGNPVFVEYPQLSQGPVPENILKSPSLFSPIAAQDTQPQLLRPNYILLSPTAKSSYYGKIKSLVDENIQFTQHTNKLQSNVQPSLDATGHSPCQKSSPIFSGQANEVATIESTIEQPELLNYLQYTIESPVQVLPQQITQDNLAPANACILPSSATLSSTGWSLAKYMPKLPNPATLDLSYNKQSIDPNRQYMAMSPSYTIPVLYEDSSQLSKNTHREALATAPLQSAISQNTVVSSSIPLGSTFIPYSPLSPLVKPIYPLPIPVTQYSTPTLLPADTINPNEDLKATLIKNPQLSLNPFKYTFKMPSSSYIPIKQKYNPLPTALSDNSAFLETEPTHNIPNIKLEAISDGPDMSSININPQSQINYPYSSSFPLRRLPCLKLPHYTTKISPTVDYISTGKDKPISQITDSLNLHTPKVKEKGSSQLFLSPYTTPLLNTDLIQTTEPYYDSLPKFRPENSASRSELIWELEADGIAQYIPKTMHSKPLLKLDTEMTSYSVPQANTPLESLDISDTSEIDQSVWQLLKTRNPPLPTFNPRSQPSTVSDISKNMAPSSLPVFYTRLITPPSLPTSSYTKPVLIPNYPVPPSYANAIEPGYTASLSPYSNALIPSYTSPIIPSYSRLLLQVSPIGPNLSPILSSALSNSELSENYLMRNSPSKELDNINYLIKQPSLVIASISTSQPREYGKSDQGIDIDEIGQPCIESSFETPDNESAEKESQNLSAIVPDHTREQVLKSDLYPKSYNPLRGTPLLPCLTTRQLPLQLKPMINIYPPNLSVNTQMLSQSIPEIPLNPITSLTLPYSSLTSPLLTLKPPNSYHLPNPSTNLPYSWQPMEPPKIPFGISPINLVPRTPCNTHQGVSEARLPPSPSIINSNYLPNTVSPQIIELKSQPTASEITGNYISLSPTKFELTTNTPPTQSLLTKPLPISNYNEYNSPISPSVTGTLPLLSTLPQSLSKFKSFISPQYVKPLSQVETLSANRGFFPMKPLNSQLMPTFLEKYVELPAEYTSAMPNIYKSSLRNDNSLAFQNWFAPVNSQLSLTSAPQLNLPYKQPISNILLPESQILPLKDSIVSVPKALQINASPSIYVSSSPGKSDHLQTVSNIPSLAHHIPQNNYLLPCTYSEASLEENSFQTKPLCHSHNMPLSSTYQPEKPLESAAYYQPQSIPIFNPTSQPVDIYQSKVTPELYSPLIVPSTPIESLSLLKPRPTIPFSLKPLNVHLSPSTSLTELDSQLQTVPSVLPTTSPLLSEQMIQPSHSISYQHYATSPSTDTTSSMKFTEIEPKTYQLTSTGRPSQLPSISITPDTASLGIEVSKIVYPNKQILPFINQYQPPVPMVASDSKNILVSPYSATSITAPENILLSQVPTRKSLPTSAGKFYTEPQIQEILISPDIFKAKKSSTNGNSNNVLTHTLSVYSNRQPQIVYPVPYKSMPSLKSEIASHRPYLPLDSLPKVIEVNRPLQKIQLSASEHSQPSQVDYGLLDTLVAKLSPQSQLMHDTKYKSPHLSSFKPNQPSTSNLPLLKYYPQSSAIYRTISPPGDGYLPSDSLMPEANADYLQTPLTSSQPIPDIAQYVTSKIPTKTKTLVLTHSDLSTLPTTTIPIDTVPHVVISNPSSRTSLVSPVPHLNTIAPPPLLLPQFGEMQNQAQMPILQTISPVCKATIITPPVEKLHQHYFNSFKFPRYESPMSFGNKFRYSILPEIPFESTEPHLKPKSNSVLEPTSVLPELSTKYVENNILMNDLDKIDTQPKYFEAENVYSEKLNVDSTIESLSETYSNIPEIIEKNEDFNKPHTNNEASLDSAYKNTESINKFEYYRSEMKNLEHKFNHNIDYNHQSADGTSANLHISKEQPYKYEIHNQQPLHTTSANTVSSELNIDTNIMNENLYDGKIQAVFERTPEPYVVIEPETYEYKSNTFGTLPTDSQYPTVNTGINRINYSLPYLTKPLSNVSNVTPNFSHYKSSYLENLKRAPTSQCTKTPYEASLAHGNFYDNNHIGKSIQVYTLPTLDTKFYGFSTNTYRFGENPYSSASPGVGNGFTKIPSSYVKPVTQLVSPLISTSNENPNIPAQLPVVNLPTAQLMTAQTEQLSTEQTPIPKYNPLKPTFKSYSPQIISPHYPMQFSQTSLESDSPDTSLHPGLYNNIDNNGYSGYKTYRIPAPNSEQVYQIPSVPKLSSQPCITQYPSTIPQYQKLSPNMLVLPSRTSGSYITEVSIPSSKYAIDDVPICKDNLNENSEIKTNLINYINSKKELKSNLFNNNELEIPLGNFAITNHVPCKDFTIQTKNPSIGLKVWKSTVKVIEAEIKLKIKDFSVNNFMPVVNKLDDYDIDEIRKIIKVYIDEKYGNHIEITEPYTINNQYTVIKDFDQNLINDKCNLLWPTDYV